MQGFASGARIRALSGRRLPETWSWLKLDRSMIRDVHTHSTKQRLVRSIADVGRSLDIEGVAEGSEVPEERDALKYCKRDG